MSKLYFIYTGNEDSFTKIGVVAETPGQALRDLEQPIRELRHAVGCYLYETLAYGVVARGFHVDTSETVEFELHIDQRPNAFVFDWYNAVRTELPAIEVAACPSPAERFSKALAELCHMERLMDDSTVDELLSVAINAGETDMDQTKRLGLFFNMACSNLLEDDDA